MECKYCESENVRKYGTYKETQYYYCNDCKRKFSNPDAIPNGKPVKRKREKPMTSVAQVRLK